MLKKRKWTFCHFYYLNPSEITFSRQYNKTLVSKKYTNTLCCKNILLLPEEQIFQWEI